jgi:hypothetical protein
MLDQGDVPGLPQMLTVTGIRMTVVVCRACAEWIDELLRPLIAVIDKYGITAEPAHAPQRTISASRGDGKVPCPGGCGRLLKKGGVGQHVVAHHPELAERCTRCEKLTTNMRVHLKECSNRNPGVAEPAPAAEMLFVSAAQAAVDESHEYACTAAGCTKPGPYPSARALGQHGRNHPELHPACQECGERISAMGNHYRRHHPNIPMPKELSK